MTPRLTVAQRRVLGAMALEDLRLPRLGETLYGPPVGEPGNCRVNVCDMPGIQQRTVAAWESVGWVVLSYTNQFGERFWQITPAGRAALGR